MLARSSLHAPRSGAVLIWLVLCLGIIVIIVALGVDGGRMLEERRQGQSAADVAALAAANDLYENYVSNQGLDPSGTAAAAARQAAADNGYANDGTRSIVTVNIPPQSGPHTGKPEYVEVVIESHPQGTFSALFTGNLKVKARAVALGRPKGLGVLALEPSAPLAGVVAGIGTVNVANAPVVINSSALLSFVQLGLVNIDALLYDIVGGISLSGLGSILGPIFTGVTPTLDPLRLFPAPNPATYPIRSLVPTSVTLPGPTVLQPGVYKGGVSVSLLGSVQMMPGVHIMDGGGFKVSGSGSVQADGVMIYNTGAPAGPIQIGGGGTVNITAATSGTYQGISIFQDRAANPTVSITGTSKTQIGGTVYAAGAAVQLASAGTTSANVLGGGYISKTLGVTALGSFTVDAGSNRPRVPEVRLVE